MRRTPETEQEQRGLGQVLSCFTDWKLDQPQKDLGEDVVVQIYEGGTSTGVSFYLQLKTCAAFSTYMTARDRSALSYPLEVKDLLHWDRASPEASQLCSQPVDGMRNVTSLFSMTVLP
jgi:hypothetical protein